MDIKGNLGSGGMVLKTELMYLIVEIVLFVILVVVSLFVFFGWGYVEISDEQRGGYVEVSLPVINWGKYSNLSKAENGDIFE